MKKYLYLIILFTVSLSFYAQETKLAWDYPVKPGTEEWGRLKTNKERITAVQVPENVLSKLSSEEVLKLCVTFPSFGEFTAFNTPQEGFYVMLSQFNIFQHLLSMKDVGKYLIPVYKDAGMSGFKKLPYSNDFWTIKLDYLELLLSQKEILQTLTLEEKVELLSEAREKFSEKMNHESFSSLPALQSTVRIMANTLDIEEYPELKTFSNQQTVRKFTTTGLVDDVTLIDEMVRMTDGFY
jgi:hypothetical protein